MKPKIYKAKNGELVELDVNNDQQHDRPGKYFYCDADYTSDICVANGQKSGKTNDLLKLALKVGLDNLKIDGESLNIDDYNFSTSTMLPNIRNIGTHEQQKALYVAMIEEDKTTTPEKAVVPPQTEAVVPQMATANTEAIVPKVEKPKIKTSEALLKWIVNAFDSKMSSADIIAELQKCNTVEVVDAHILALPEFRAKNNLTIQ